MPLFLSTDSEQMVADKCYLLDRELERMHKTIRNEDSEAVCFELTKALSSWLNEIIKN